MFGYEDLKNTEKEVRSITTCRLNGFYEYGPKFVDLRFCFQQFFGKMDDIETSTGEMQSIAYIHFVQLLYTIKLIYDQIMTGYYLESEILIRHLFETLVQLKYFYKYPQNIEAHFNNSISIKNMVRGITNKPLFENYRRLSTYAHGIIVKDIHRTDRENNVTYVGNVYMEYNCTVVINYFCELMLGFINIYSAIFTQNEIDENSKTKELKKYVYDLCILSRDSHMKINEESRKWHDSMSDLIF